MTDPANANQLAAAGGREVLKQVVANLARCAADRLLQTGGDHDAMHQVLREAGNEELAADLLRQHPQALREFRQNARALAAYLRREASSRCCARSRARDCKGSGRRR